MNHYTVEQIIVELKFVTSGFPFVQHDRIARFLDGKIEILDSLSVSIIFGSGNLYVLLTDDRLFKVSSQDDITYLGQLKFHPIQMLDYHHNSILALDFIGKLWMISGTGELVQRLIISDVLSLPQIPYQNLNSSEDHLRDLLFRTIMFDSRGAQRQVVKRLKIVIQDDDPSKIAFEISTTAFKSVTFQLSQYGSQIIGHGNEILIDGQPLLRSGFNHPVVSASMLNEDNILVLLSDGSIEIINSFSRVQIKNNHYFSRLHSFNGMAFLWTKTQKLVRFDISSVSVKRISSSL